MAVVIGRIRGATAVDLAVDCQGGDETDRFGDSEVTAGGAKLGEGSFAWRDEG